MRSESSSLKMHRTKIASHDAQISDCSRTEQLHALWLWRDLRARHVCSSAMDKSRVATINSVYSISHEPVSKQIYLTQYGLMAERHWREFRPKMVRELEAKGTLMEALFEAQERTIGEMEALTQTIGNGAEADSAAGARSRLGDDSREIHSPSAGRESLNDEQLSHPARGCARPRFAETKMPGQLRGDRACAQTRCGSARRDRR